MGHHPGMEGVGVEAGEPFSEGLAVGGVAVAVVVLFQVKNRILLVAVAEEEEEEGGAAAEVQTEVGP